MTCTHKDTIVYDSRKVEYKLVPTIWRRRECTECKARFTTYEFNENALEDVARGVELLTMERIKKRINKLFDQPTIEE